MMRIGNLICSKILPVAGLLLTLSVVLIPANSYAGKLYKWVDDNGVVHYSDKMPPDLSQEAHEELNQRGVRLREIERVPTEEERMAEKIEQSVQEQERRIEAEKEARRRMRDQILLQTFTTERDLLITRDDRINAVDSIIALTLNNNKRIVGRIEETQGKISRLTNSGRDVPENLSKELESLNGQYEKNKSYIELKQNERQQLNARFADDLQRFRELKGLDSGPVQIPEPVTDITPQNVVDLPKPEDVAKHRNSD
jgi:hypothetical protein